LLGQEICSHVCFSYLATLAGLTCFHSGLPHLADCRSGRVRFATGTGNDEFSAIRQADSHHGITHSGGFSRAKCPNDIVVPELTGIGHLPTMRLRSAY
jgi:hypothetical protein